MKLIFGCFPCLKSKICDGDEQDTNETQLSEEISTEQIKAAFSVEKSNFTKEDHSLTMFGWGSNDYGQLGCGTERRFIKEPTVIEGRTKVIRIASGLRHTLYLTKGNNVYSCGNNDYGQLGQTKSQSRPSSVEELEAIEVANIYAGDYFSLALTEEGALFGWGRSEHNELLQSSCAHRPKLLAGLSQHKIVQVACGASHVIALTQNGTMVVWGSNEHGQLGLGAGQPSLVAAPTPLAAMHGLPILQIFSGANHSGCLTHSGAIFAWGKNNFGQLGTGSNDQSQIPALLKTIRDQRVAYVAMGEDHSVALTIDGGVFTWGHGANGQLGHGTLASQTTPRKVVELMGNCTISLACGRRHTLVLTSKRSVFGFGLNSNNQLGGLEDNSVRLPKQINFDMVADIGSPRAITAGGDQSFCGYMDRADASTVEHLSKDLTIPNLKPIKRYQKWMGECCARVKSQAPLPIDVTDDLALIFQSAAALNASFLAPDHYKTSARYHGLNLAECCHAIAKMFNHRDSLYVAMKSLSSLFVHLPNIPADIETLRVYIVAPVCFHFAAQYKIDSVESILLYVRRLMAIKGGGEKVLRYWLGSLDQIYFKRIIKLVKDQVGLILDKLGAEYAKSEPLNQLCLFLERLYEINETHKIVPFAEFYIKTAPSADQPLFEDWKVWQQSVRKWSPGNFSFCLYPFIFDSKSKATLLRVESQITQVSNAQVAQQQNIRDIANHFMGGQGGRLRQPHLTLEVSRDNIVHDTVHQIERIIFNESNGVGALRKPLLAKFRGEEAHDANVRSEAGVRREFFMLLLQKLLCPDYGMIVEHEESNLSWFRDSTDNSPDLLRDFFLLGVICGLAIYNDNIVDLHFPLALYKKLLNVEPNLDDLTELMPVVGRSMKQLIEAGVDDCVDEWGLSFSLDREEFGEMIEVELVSGGANIPVTFENRKDYVEEYINYVFNKSCLEKYRRFAEGFNRIVENPVYRFFRAEELQQIVVGAVVINWKQIEDNAKYHDGYTLAHPAIKVFWSAFHQLTDSEKKQFLIFLTGSSRVPLGGLNINIKHVAVSPDHLPVAHTCFNLLDLPPYKDVKKTLVKLRQALATHQSGFQLV